MIRAGSIAALLTAAVTSSAVAVTAADAAVAPPAQRPAHSGLAVSGSKLWQARYTGVGGLGAFSLASAIGPDGSAVFITGGSRKKVRVGSADAGQTLAYSTSTGATLWRTAYDPGHRNTSEFDAIAVSPDGSAVYVTGNTTPTTGGPGTVVTAAYSATTGAALWIDATTVRGSGQAVATSPDGTTVYVTGGDTISAVNAATGVSLWTDTTSGTAQSEAVSPDGSMVFANIGTLNGDLVLAVNADTGATTWSDITDRMNVAALAISPDSGTLFAAGAANGLLGTATAVARTIAFTAATGSTVWTRTARSTAGGGFANALAVSPDGTSVFVAGSSDSLAGVATTWAYNAATGASRWQRDLADFGADAIAVSPDGSRVFTAGDGVSSSPRQVFSTAAYDPATGAVLWRQGGDRAGPDWYSFATSLGVTPDSATVIASGDVNTPAPGTKANAVTVGYGA